MGLREIFAELPGGRRLSGLMNDTDILDMLRKGYINSTSDDAARRQSIKRRLDLYENNVRPYVEAHIRRMFSDPKVIDERLRVLDLGKWQNVTRRIVHELARVYSNPARRLVADRNEGYQEFIDHVKLDDTMRTANRLATLCNETFVYLRSEQVDGEFVPALDILTPDKFSIIPHPLYPMRIAGVILNISSAHGGDQTPHYMVITSDQAWYLDKNGFLLWEEENPYGFIPGALIHASQPYRSLLDSLSGDDIMAAHEAVVLLNTFLIHGSKVSTKVPYVQGDGSYTAQGQTMDHTSTVMLGEGMSPGVIDMRSDPQEQIRAATAIIMQVAANYGIPEDIFNRSFMGTTGIVMDAKLSGLTERRNEQLPIFRRIERDIARKASVVCSRDCASRFHFGTDGWQIDFGEVARPQDPIERLRWRKEARSMGLRTIIDDLQEDNPDLDEARAWKRLYEIIEIRSTEVEAMRALNMPQDPTQPGQGPASNGAANGSESGESAPATEPGDLAHG